MDARNGFRSSSRRGAILSPLAALAVLGLGLWSCGRGGLVTGSAAEDAEYRTSLTADGRGIAFRPPASNWILRRIDALPAYDPAKRVSFQVDLRQRDVGSLDLSGRLADLLKADFDTETRWPGRLPDGFDPALIMEYGKNPGLGVRGLHQGGIDGRGVGIAVIDQALFVDHVEYKDRLRLYEEVHCGDRAAGMHGAAVASIAVGKSVGVAPGADLYYIGETSGTYGGQEFSHDFTHLARAIERVLKVNKRLPAGRKIRVIAIAQGWTAADTGSADAARAVERAGKEGLFVVSSSLFETSGRRLAFHGLGRVPAADPEAYRSYGPGLWWAESFYRGKYRPAAGVTPLLVPMDSRTTAGFCGLDEYAFNRQGGWSWAIPWIAGLYALACQVRSEVTPELFWETALATGDSLEVPPRENPLTEAEIERRVPEAVEKAMAQVKAGMRGLGEGAGLERYLADFHNYFTGQKLARMSETDFRAWEEKIAREGLSAIGRPVVLEKIVNPVRLIAALKRT